MSLFLTILILTLVVSLSQIAARILPFQIPLPLVQIAIGALLAWPNILHIDLDPELFLVLFIPPLLFYDGRRTALPEFMHNIREILGLALVLVLLTIVGVGYLTYLLIPNISLPAAFALAAVLSPTDAVALSGIVGDGRIAKNKMAIIEGEALMNDASGLVSFKFAILIAIGAMQFHLIDASLAFAKVALGGLAAGFIITWLYSKLLRMMSRWTDDDPTTQIIFVLLLPFAAYLTAEHFGVSGILAAVSAGMTISQKGIIRNAPLATRLQSGNTWSMLTYVFNGMVFLILGLQMPRILKETLNDAKIDPLLAPWQLFAFVFLLYIALILTRFCWLWLMRQFSRTTLAKHPLTFLNYSNRDLWISTFAGVRGAITLAGVLSIPLFLDAPNNFWPFPGRYALVFIAAGVILLSLVSAAIILPLLLPGNLIDKSEEIKQEQIARGLMAEQGILGLEKVQSFLMSDSAEQIDPELFNEVSTRVIGALKRRSGLKNSELQSLQAENLERRMRLIALSAERATLYELRAKNKISQEVMDKILYDVDLLETVLARKS